MCFSKHHLKKTELDQINVDGYRLGAAYCRQVVKRGGVCIFKFRLSYESWDSIFSCNGNTDTDILFTLFHSNYLRIFYTSFPSCKIIERSNNNYWLTPGIRISCKRKICLYLLTKDSDDVILNNYCNQYCKTLTSVIKEAKTYMYNNRIINSSNKTRTTWNIIKTETNRLKGPITATVFKNKTLPRFLISIFCQ